MVGAHGCKVAAPLREATVAFITLKQCKFALHHCSCHQPAAGLQHVSTPLVSKSTCLLSATSWHHGSVRQLAGVVHVRRRALHSHVCGAHHMHASVGCHAAGCPRAQQPQLIYAAAVRRWVFICSRSSCSQHVPLQRQPLLGNANIQAGNTIFYLSLLLPALTAFALEILCCCCSTWLLKPTSGSPVMLLPSVVVLDMGTRRHVGQML